MKYIKTFEDSNFKMIPGYCYTNYFDYNVLLYFAYNNNKNNDGTIEYPYLILEIYKKDIDDSRIVAYAESAITEFSPLNIKILDYIKQNNFVEKTLDIIQEYIDDKYSYYYDKMVPFVKEFQKTLLSDNDIQIIYNQNKYNL